MFTRSLAGTFIGIAQILIMLNPLNAQTDEQMARVFEWRFSMDAPDTSFVPMNGEGGWEEPASTAKVICMATPTPFERMTQDLDALSSEEGQKLLEKSTVEINNVQGLLLLLEFSPVAGEDTEVVYSLMFARPYEDVSLILSAQYPKSEHERLYAKVLRAFGTVRRNEN